MNNFRALLFLLLTAILAGCSKSNSEIDRRARAAFKQMVEFAPAHSEKPPSLVIYESSIDTKCGKTDGSGYCPRDKTIYISQQQISELNKVSPESVDLVVAHEFAHAMQHEYGFRRKYTVLNELQADCLAGVYLSKVSRNNLETFKKSMLLAWDIGDYDWGEKYHHGFPNQRLQSFVVGTSAAVIDREEGILVCLDLF